MKTILSAVPTSEMAQFAEVDSMCTGCFVESWFCTVCVRVGVLLMGSIANLLDSIRACCLSSSSSSRSLAVCNHSS